MLPLAVPLILYILLSLPGVQSVIASKAEDELSMLLGTEISVGNVDIAPFNRVILSDVLIKDYNGKEALAVKHIGGGVSFWESLWNHRWIITYVELIDLDLKVYRSTDNAVLNIQPIIDRLKSEEKKESKSLDLAVNLLVVRRSSLSYDVLDKPYKEDGRFDINHITIRDFKADICAPYISDKRVEVEIKRMGALADCGIVLRELTAGIYADRSEMRVENFLVELEKSRIAVNDLVLDSPLSGTFCLRNALRSSVETLSDTYINTSDLSPFASYLDDLDLRIDVDFEMYGSMDDLYIDRMEIGFSGSDARLSGHGRVENITGFADSLLIDFHRLNVEASMPRMLGYISRDKSPLKMLYEKISFLEPLKDINLLGDFSYNSGNISFNGSLDTGCGNLDIDFAMSNLDKKSPLKVDGTIETLSFNPSSFLSAIAPLTHISLGSKIGLTIAKGDIKGYVSVDIPEAQWDGYTFSDISASADFYGNKAEGQISSSSSGMDFSITGGAELMGEFPLTELYANVNKFSLSPFVRYGKYKDYDLSFDLDASVHGRNPDTFYGWVKLSDFAFAGKDRSLVIPVAEIEAVSVDSVRKVNFNSSFADADITGNFSVKTLSQDLKAIVASVYPSLLPESVSDVIPNIGLSLDMTVKEDSAICRFFGLPVDVIYPMTLKSNVSGGLKPAIDLSIDMPYLRNKDKLIEGSRLEFSLDGVDRSSNIMAHTAIPTKNGMLDLNLNSSGGMDSIATSVGWAVDRQAEFNGDFDFSTVFSRSDEYGDLHTDIAVHQTKMVFNDSAWTVNPSEIHISPHKVVVENLSGGRGQQSLSIDGVASSDSIDRLVVKLDKIDLDYIFETLDISEAVQFGGRATGEFYGLRLLSSEPVLYTPHLYVKGFKYNFCEMGDGDIRSSWNHDTKTININAEIIGKNGTKSLADGYIRPMTEELDFKFSARRAPVGFMAPFMSAFTSKISGEVSGDARLYGTFKDLDMYGDLFVKDLSMRVDFTNVEYTTTDSVHITPGLIKFDNIKLKDRFGKSADLSGYVKHSYFHDPSFRFDITGAKDLLVYDIDENQTGDPWYGRIFGNGRAVIDGSPGRVDINVAMATAAKSTFTFVLSDAEQALDYTFITLRDKDKARKDSIAALDTTPLIVRQLRDRVKRNDTGTSSIYEMTFEVDVTPLAAMNLIMDPVGGDRITAYGNGHVRMSYNSDGDLRMYGDYKINRGAYNFTLQDIILKEFTIRDGSRISFLGDPYAAQLDIIASYTVNANLSDLDESFLEDRELNRTNVPVDALMMVKGDMRQPDIAFDLDFPTLTRDTYRKVRSIVSTEDMMNRQIIYLLALNKFYTPDYMTATHGNELVSVASSTISSRLGAMLGELSDNWSIAPAIRSDKGDFSDVEVDVALSSHLLNNRLLFNGNFGYRDNSMNNNSFIGDFDIRYLLNRAGTIQLKAYNRYNDQNYYLKSALTTQGVGVVFKRDFDSIFSFLKRKSSKKDEENSDKEGE